MLKMFRFLLRFAVDLGLDLVDFGRGDSDVFCDIRICDFFNIDENN